MIFLMFGHLRFLADLFQSCASTASTNSYEVVITTALEVKQLFSPNLIPSLLKMWIHHYLHTEYTQEVVIILLLLLQMLVKVIDTPFAE